MDHQKFTRAQVGNAIVFFCKDLPGGRKDKRTHKKNGVFSMLKLSIVEAKQRESVKRFLLNLL